MAVTINAKGTSVDSFKIGKNGITIPGTGMSTDDVLTVDSNGNGVWQPVPQKYDIGFAILQIPNVANSTIGILTLVRNISIVTSSPGIAKAEVPSSTSVIFDIVLDSGGSSTTVGTVSFLASNTTGTIVLNNNLSLSSGDVLKIRTQGTVSTDIANIAITLPGTIV